MGRFRKGKILVFAFLMTFISFFAYTGKAKAAFVFDYCNKTACKNPVTVHLWVNGTELESTMTDDNGKKVYYGVSKKINSEYITRVDLPEATPNYGQSDMQYNRIVFNGEGVVAWYDNPNFEGEPVKSIYPAKKSQAYEYNFYAKMGKIIDIYVDGYKRSVVVGRTYNPTYLDAYYFVVPGNKIENTIFEPDEGTQFIKYEKYYPITTASSYYRNVNEGKTCTNNNDCGSYTKSAREDDNYVYYDNTALLPITALNTRYEWADGEVTYSIIHPKTGKAVSSYTMLGKQIIPRLFEYLGFIDSQGKMYDPIIEMKEEYDGLSLTSVVDSKMSCSAQSVDNFANAVHSIGYYYDYTRLNYPRVILNSEYDARYLSKKNDYIYYPRELIYSSVPEWGQTLEDPYIAYKFNSCVPFDINISMEYELYDVPEVTIVIDNGTPHNVVRNSTYTLPSSGKTKAAEAFSVTFKYQDGKTADKTQAYTKVYTPNGFKINGVHYNFGEEIIVDRSIYIETDYDVTITGPAFPTPTRQNYTFKGWYDATVGGHIVENANLGNSMTVYAQWADKDRVVIIRPDGISVEVEKGSEYTIPDIPYKYDSVVSNVAFNHNDGTGKVEYGTVTKKYTKAGVKVKETGDIYSVGQVIIANRNMTLLGNYTETVKPAKFPSNPTREGHEFIGWFNQIEGGTEYTSYSGDQDLALYAQWLGDNSVVRIVYPDGACVDNSTCYDSNYSDNVDKDSNYTLKNNKSVSSRYDVIFKFEDGVTQDQTGFVVERKTGNGWYIDGTHYEQGQTIVANRSMTVNADYVSVIVASTFPKTPTRSGYKFLGWFDSNGTKYTKYDKPENITLYAHWELETSYVLPEIPAKNAENIATVTLKFQDDKTKDKVLYVQKLYSAVDYTVNGGSYNNAHYNVGDTINMTDGVTITPNYNEIILEVDLLSATRDGYYFLGWFDAPENGTKYTTYSGTRDKTFYAHWTTDVITTLCKRAKTLHTDSNGTPYGRLGTEGELVVGDAFDCDVNGDGIYDAETERFYYVNDFYDTVTMEYDHSIASLIYYTDYMGHPITNLNDETYTVWNNTTPLDGPTVAMTYLPTEEEWPNAHLYKTERYPGSQSTRVGPTNIVDYTGYAARMLDTREVIDSGCVYNYNNRIKRVFYNFNHTCDFLGENIRYNNKGKAPKERGYWLENHGGYCEGLPDCDDNRHYAWNLIMDNGMSEGWDGLHIQMRETNYGRGVRPVIDVPRNQIEDNPGETIMHTITYPEGIEQKALHKSTFVFGDVNTSSGVSTNYTVTFKYQDDVTADTTSKVKVQRIPTAYKIGNTRYNKGDSLIVLDDYQLEYIYVDTTSPATFPSNPTREGYTFVGWFDAQYGGNEYTSYAEAEDITLYAHWEGGPTPGPDPNNILCRKATRLHTERCTNTTFEDTNLTCIGNGYSLNSTVTFGNIPTDGQLVTGDAFDCDVNGDGVYNSTTERFYYISDYYDTLTAEFDSSYATLVYYINVENGSINAGSSDYYYKDSQNPNSDINYMGPGTAYVHMPTTTQWSNATLKESNRQIRGEYGSLHHQLKNKSNKAYVRFEYTDRAARLLTIQEILNGCEISEALYGSDGYPNLISKCLFLFENTGFTTNPTSAQNAAFYTTLLETPANGDTSNRGTNIFALDNGGRHLKTWSPRSKAGVRPTIDVPKSRLDITLSNTHTVTLPDRVDTVPHEAPYTIPKNKYDKDSDEGATITFKNNNGQEDTELHVINEYTNNGFTIDDVHYDTNDIYVVLKDIILVPDYTINRTSPEFPIPIKDGYEFDGWYTENEEGTLVESYNGSEDITLYAHWTFDPGNTITLPVNNETKTPEIKTVTFKPENEEEDIVETITVTYRPNGWLVNGIHHNAGDQIRLYDNTIIEPSFEVDEVTQVTFPSDPTKEGYTFIGWFDSQINGGNKYTSYNKPYDITLYAHYSENNVVLPRNDIPKDSEILGTITFVYHNGQPNTTSNVIKTFKPNGWLIDGVHYKIGDVVDMTTVTSIEPDYDEFIQHAEFPANPTKEGYEFVGWYTLETGGEIVTTAREAGDITVHAQYTNDYALLMTGGYSSEENSMRYKLRDLVDSYTYSAPGLTFRRANLDEYNEVKNTLTSDNLISDANSPKPVYAWFTGTELLYYSAANVIFAHQNSSYYFTNGKIGYLDVSGINTSKVTDMSYMFWGAKGEINLSNFDTHNVTNMSDMFLSVSVAPDLSSFNTSKVTNMSSMFYCAKFSTIDVSYLDTHNVTTMSYMFAGSGNGSPSRITELDLSTFDTSNVTTFSHTFYDAEYLTTLDVSTWDVSNATSGEGLTDMFDWVNRLTGVDVINWDVSKIKDMYNLFRRAYSITELDLSSWDTSSVTNMGGMFENDGRLTTVYVSEKWTTDKVDRSSLMFVGNTSIVGQKGTTYDSNYIDKTYAIIDDAPEHPGYLTYKKSSNLHIITLPDRVDEVEHGSEYTIPTNTYDKSSENGATVTLDYQDGRENTILYVRKDYINSGFNDGENHYNDGQIITVLKNMTLNPDYIETTIGVDLSNPTREGYIFNGWYTEPDGNGELVKSYNAEEDITFYAQWVPFTPTPGEYTLPTNRAFKPDEVISTVTFYYHNGQPNTTSNVVRRYTPSGWLVDGKYCADGTTITVTEDTVIEERFISTITHANFPTDPTKEGYEFTGWYTEETGGTKVTVLSSDDDMIVHAQYTNDYAKLDTGSMINSKLSNIISSHDATDIIFRKATAEEYASVSESLTTSNIISATLSPNVVYLWLDDNKLLFYSNASTIFANEYTQRMFASSSKIVSIDMRGINTIKSKNMNQLFGYCRNLVDLNISELDTKNTTDMSYMFTDLDSMLELDVSNLETSNATNMEHMFSSMKNATQINLGIFDTSKVTRMGGMFSGDKNLTSIDLSNFNTSNVTNFESMFYNANLLKEIDVSSFDTKNAIYFSNMFDGCSSLESIDVTTWDTSNAIYMSSMFYGDKKLTEIDLSNFNTSKVQYMASMFSYCTLLKTIYVSEKWDTTSVTNSNNMFYKSTNLVGQGGTTYNASYINKTYARIDYPDRNQKGYLTYYINYDVVYPDYSMKVGKQGTHTIRTNSIEKDPETFTVTFDAQNGKTPTDVTGSVIYLPSGWLYEDNHYNPGEYMIIEKSVTFEPDYVTTTEAIEFPEDPTKEGYTFVGWFDAISGGNKYTSYSEAKDITLYAHYIGTTGHTVTLPDYVDYVEHGTNYVIPNNTYDKNSEEAATVTFKLQNGEEDIIRTNTKSYINNGFTIDDVHYNSGATYKVLKDITLIPDYTESISNVEFPKNPTQEGYTFVGWFDSMNGGNEYSSYNGKTNITLYAHYKTVEPDPGYYRLSVNNLPKDDEIISTVTFKYHNGTADTTSNVVKKFIPHGWLVDGEPKADGEIIPYTEETVIERNYVETIQNASFPTNPVKSEYEFVGWFTLENGGEQVTVLNSHEDIVLHAHYTNSYAYLIVGNQFSRIYKNFRPQLTTGASFRKATTEEFALVSGDLSSLQIISTNDSPNPVYMWTSENTILYYSNADVIFANENTYYMFHQNDTSAGRYPIYYVDVSGINFSKTTSMEDMFGDGWGHNGYRTITLGNFDTHNVTNMKRMFFGCNNITSLDLSGIDTSNVTNMNLMFGEYSFEELDVSNFDTHNVTDMSLMFAYITNLRELDLSNFDTRKVTTMAAMFQANADLESVDLSSFDTSNVTGMSNMFRDCANLRELDLSNFDTSKVTSFTYMLGGTTNLTSIDLSNFDTSSATEMNSMFQNSNLTTIYVSDKWKTTNVTSSTKMFTNAVNIVGQEGTIYDENHIDKEYARVDEVSKGRPGYLTYKRQPILTHNVTLPDRVDEVPHGESYTIPNNKYDKDPEDLATVTFVYGDDRENTVSHVQNGYLNTGFTIGEDHVNDGDVIVVNEDITLVPDYSETTLGAEFPEEPTRNGYVFTGWYTDPEDGEEVTSYYETEDITLYAHWTDKYVRLTVDGETTNVRQGTEYTVPSSKEDSITFTLDENYDGGSVTDYTLESTSYIDYQTINGVNHYPNDTVTINEDTVVISSFGELESTMTPEYNKPERNGYIFKGWLYDNKEVFVEDIKSSDKYLDGETLTASWEEIESGNVVLHVTGRFTYDMQVPAGSEVVIDDATFKKEFNYSIDLRDSLNDKNYRMMLWSSYSPYKGTYEGVNVNKEDTIVVNSESTLNLTYTNSEESNFSVGTPVYIMEQDPPVVLDDVTYVGVFTEDNNTSTKIDVRNIKYDNRIHYGKTYYIRYVYNEATVIVTLDGEAYVVEKGPGNLPSATTKDNDIKKATFINNGKSRTYDIVKSYEFVQFYVSVPDESSNVSGNYYAEDEFNYDTNTDITSIFVSSVNYPEVPIVSDISFIGWYTEPNGGDKVTEINEFKDYTLYARYDNVPVHVTIEDQTYEVDYGEEFTFPSWNDKTSDSITLTLDIDGETSSETITTNYTFTSFEYEGTTYNPNDTMVVTEDRVVTVNYDESTVFNPEYTEPSIEGKVFIEWLDENNNKVDITKLTGKDSNYDGKTLTAHFETINPDQIVVDFDGERMVVDKNTMGISDLNNMVSPLQPEIETMTVYIDHNDGTGTIDTVDVVKTSTTSGYTVNGTEYGTDSDLMFNEDVVVRSIFTANYAPNIFNNLPEGVRGLFTTATGGELVDTYDNVHDGDTLYYQYNGSLHTVTLEGEVIAYVLHGENYTLPVNNVARDMENLAAVTFDYMDGRDNTINYVRRRYVAEGWTINNEQYSNGGVITVNEDIELVRNYTESIQGVDFPVNPKRSGYVFDGWYKETTYETKVEEYDTQEDITLYAKWIKQITINEDGEISIELQGFQKVLDTKPNKNNSEFNITFKYNYEGSPADKVQTLSKYYRFTGWDVNGTFVEAGVLYTFNEDTILTSQYEKVVNNNNLPNDPTRDGYTFLGWFNTPKDGEQVDITKIDSNTTVYAYWQEFNPNQVTLTWDGKKTVHDIGTVINLDRSEGKTKEEKKATVTFVMNKEGYDNKIVYINNVYTRDHLVINDVDHDDTGEYTLNEDTVITSVYTNEVVYPELPKVNDGRFLGFYTESTGGTEVTTLEGINTNTTYYAHWTTETVTIDFDGDVYEVEKGTEINFTQGKAKGLDNITVTFDYNKEGINNKTVTFTTTYVFDYYSVNDEKYYVGEKYIANTDTVIRSMYTETESNDFEGYSNNDWDLGYKPGNEYLTGWTTERNGSTEVDFTELTGKNSDYNNATIYAKWNEVTGDLSVTIDSMDPYTVSPGEQILIPQDKVLTLDEPRSETFNVTFVIDKDNSTTRTITKSYTFDYFTLNGNGKHQRDDIVTFYSDSIIKSNWKDSYTYPDMPTNDDSRFIGWFTKEEGGLQVTTLEGITEETTLYAHYLENDYVVYFDGVAYNYDDFTTSVNPINLGYASNEIENAFTLTLDYQDDDDRVEVYNYSVNNTHVGWTDSSNHSYGETINLSSETNGEHYTSIYNNGDFNPIYLSLYSPSNDRFIGWYTAPTGGERVYQYNGFENKTYYARYMTPTQASVTIDDEVEIYNIGDTLTLPAAKTKEGSAITITFDPDNGDSTFTKSITTSYTFEGFKYAKDNQNYNPDASFTVEEDMVFNSDFTKVVTQDTWPEDPEKEGYFFLGWYTAKNGGIEVFGYNDISSNTNLYAHYTTNPEYFITITNTLTGETESVMNNSDWTFGNSKFNKSSKEKLGTITYKFNSDGYSDERIDYYRTSTPSGFYIGDDRTTVHSIDEVNNFTSDTSITPYYDENDIVTDSHVGIDQFDYDITNGNKIIKCFSKTDQTDPFDEEEYSCYTEYDSNDGDVTVYLHWRERKQISVTEPDGTVDIYLEGDIYNTGVNNNIKDPDSYTVTFKYQDEVTADTAGTHTTTYTANGWLINGEHVDNNVDITLEEDLVKTYDYIETTTEITLPEPTREEYRFIGWNSEPDGTGTTFTNININELNSDTNAYAIWSFLGITLSFDAKGGHEVDDVRLEYDTPVGDLLPTTTRDGYTDDEGYIHEYIFDGWYRDEEYSSKVSTSTIFTEDTLLYAKWIDNTWIDAYPYHEEDYVCTGSNYINTGVMLYDDTWEQDYEIGFTVKEYDSNNQPHTQSVFMNTKQEDSSRKWPGLVVRKNSNKIQITQNINMGTQGQASLSYTLPYKIKVYRIDKVVYYSVQDGPLTVLQDMSDFNQQFELPVYFCAGDDGAGGVQRYLKGTISDYYIKKGKYPGTVEDGITHTVTYPNGEVFEYPHNTIITLGANETSMDPETGAEVFFDYNDDDYNYKVKYVTNTYVADGFIINDITHYDNNSTLVVDEDKYIEYDYSSGENISPEFPEDPEREHYTFEGWYDSDDNRVTSYNGEDDITLYAHWSIEQHTVTTPNGVTTVDYGDYYVVDDDIEKPNETIATITFKPHNGDDDDVRYMYRTYYPDGWYDQNGDWYDSGDWIEVYEDLVLEPDYYEDIDYDYWPDDPYKEHYYFDGWYTEEEGGEYVDYYPYDNPHDLTLHAQWSGEEIEICVDGYCNYYEYGDEYTIDSYYDPYEDSVGEVEFVVPYEDDDYTDSRTIYKRYTQTGWMDQNGETYTANQVITVTENLDLEPVYDETVLDVEFPDDPERQGNTFLGWYTDRDGGEEVTSYAEEDSTTLYAHWDPEEFTITTPRGSNTYHYGDSYYTEDFIEKDDDIIGTVTFHNGDETDERYIYKEYTPTSWEDQKGTTYDPNEYIYVTEDLTFTQVYSENTYTDDWPDDPEKEHYTFDGWYDSEEGGDSYSEFPEEGNLELYAHWTGETIEICVEDDCNDYHYGDEFTIPDDEPKDADVLATVTFKYHNGDDDTTSDVRRVYTQNGWEDQNGNPYTSGATITLTERLELTPIYDDEIVGATWPDDPTYDDYEFVGWYTEEDGGEEITSYEGEDDIDVHARWTMTLPTDIEIDADDITLVVGETHLIEVTFIPDGTSDTITYTDYDNEIISVVDGLVTAIGSGETTITVGLENVPNVTKTIAVTVLGDKLLSDIYEVRDIDIEDEDIDRIVIGAEPNTTIGEFKDNMLNPNEYIKIYDLDNNELSDDDIVKTGQIIRLEYNGNVYDEAILILRGDIDGDGLIDVTDEALITDHILMATQITGYRFLAADVVEDGLLDVSDDSKITDYILMGI
ncbi:MAG: InlB B-repeat-containing protein, partial [Bacilli bacterium]|nr:InlB B-repeat-containing protein [Bacilli bacterium]